MKKTLASIIAEDLAQKCGDDVGGVIRRCMALCDSQGAAFLVALSGAAVAMGNCTGAMMGGLGRDPTAEDVDKVWQDLLRPMVLKTLGQDAEFNALLAQLPTKPLRIDGEDAA